MRSTLLGFITLLLAMNAQAFELVKLDELSIGYKDFAALNDKATDAVIFPEHPKEELSINVKTDVFNFGYLDATTHGTTTSAQYRAVGLELRLGLRVSDYLEVGYYHHSQHLLDRNQDQLNHFPVVDAVEVKLFLYRANPAGKGLF